MAAENFSPEESIQLIRSMIAKTRKGISHQSFYFLLWGWCSLAACIGQFLLKVVFNSIYHPMVWFINIPCLIITFYFAVSHEKKEPVKTYVGENMRYLWTGICISYIVMTTLFIKIGWLNCYPFYILLYGLGSFVTGRILQFKPFLFGAVICWGLAVTAVWVPFDYQILFAAAALLFSYIIPGHLVSKAQPPTY